jgi:hypothetical protein
MKQDAELKKASGSASRQRVIVLGVPLDRGEDKLRKAQAIYYRSVQNRTSVKVLFKVSCVWSGSVPLASGSFAVQNVYNADAAVEYVKSVSGQPVLHLLCHGDEQGNICWPVFSDSGEFTEDFQTMPFVSFYLRLTNVDKKASMVHCFNHNAKVPANEGAKRSFALSLFKPQLCCSCSLVHPHNGLRVRGDHAGGVGV